MKFLLTKKYKPTTVVLLGTAILLLIVTIIIVNNLDKRQNKDAQAKAAFTNPIVEENKKPGTKSFFIPEVKNETNRYGEDSDSNTLAMQTSNTYVQPNINGYASAASIDQGESIDFHISTAQSTYKIEISRIGWYGGAGSSLKRTISNLPGQFQPSPNLDLDTGLADANWQVSYTLQTDSTWTTGVYLAKLVPNSGSSSYIIFVVRDDSAPADILFQIPVTTYQAYNNWGGKSLYEYHSTNNERAFKVSFNRPYAAASGAGRFFEGDYNMIRFLESQGYNISYSTSVETHTSPGVISNKKMFLSNWHDEYWSKPMRDNLTAWRDQGKHLTFFNANNIYWQVRFENDANGNANRTMTCYKPGSGGVGVDPMQAINPELTTVRWRSSPVNQPENELLGVMYEDDYGYGQSYPWVVQNASHWIYSGTGLNNGDSIPGVVGFEYDRVWNNGLTPPNIEILSHSPVVSPEFGPSHANGTIYTASSEAMVFSAGTMYWSWKLDDNTFKSRGVDTRIQQMTRNILNNMIGSAPSPSPTPTTAEPSLCPCNIFGSTTPQNKASTDTRAVELGVKFRAQTNGVITGIRFYKGSGNTGTHKGTLWSATGSKLAEVTFTSESSSGWQTAYFSSPVTVQKNTTYVASYFAPNGHYAYNSNYFGSVARVNGPLIALKNGTDGGNGVYKYTSASAFPASSYSSTNYWVDVVFEASGYGVWTNKSVSPNTSGASASSVELGMKFRTTEAGFVKGVRFHKGSGNTGTHTGALWTASGTKLAQVTFSNESSNGWQTAYFTSPVAVNANTTYVISYHAPVGKYSYNTNYFLSTASTNGSLTALKTGTDGGNGVYKYGSGVLFPNQTYNSTNYWVDVIFSKTN